MAFALVTGQTTTGSDITGAGSYAATAFPGTVTVGNTLLAVVSSDGNLSGQITGLTDNKGNTWTRDFEGFNTRYVSVWRAPVTAGGTGLIITVAYNAASSNNSGIVAQEWSSASAFTKDQTKAGTGTNATPTTGASSATTVANELVIAGVVMTSTEASFTGAGAGYSNAGSKIVTNANVAMESKTVSATGAQTATFTWPTSRIYTAILVTYYEASASVTATPGLVALTLATFAPVIQYRINGASPTALTLTTFAPVVALAVIPSTKALILATFAPQVNLAVIPPTKALALTTFAPAIGQGVVPPTAALILTTFAPSIVFGVSSIPDTLALTLTGYAPVIQLVVIPPTKALVLTTFAPAINTSQTFTPAPVALVLTPYVPVVTATVNMLVTPPTTALRLTTFAPSAGAWRDVPLGIIISGSVEDRTITDLSDDRTLAAAVANRSLTGGDASNLLAGGAASATISTSTNDRTVG